MLSYSELIKRPDFISRFRYAKLDGVVGHATFGYDRYLNQKFYASAEWKQIRDAVIVRDNGLDLGCPGYPIMSSPLVHHMNPIVVQDLKPESFNQDILDPEYLICVSKRTHNAIHFADESQLPRVLVERFPGDTRLW